MNFLTLPSVKFRETWQTGSKCFTLVKAHFSRKSTRPIFFAEIKDKFAKIEKLVLKNIIQSLLITCNKLGGKGVKTNAITAFKS